ncbi:MAG: hypothetical protein ABF489_02230 [Bifidobacterium sp.]|uniref:hypothetical protein n=1 Tax=Bifidobacterium sp. TaxID=41200 RepID=UPI0039EA1E03
MSGEHWSGHIKVDSNQWGVGHGGFFTQSISIYPTFGKITKKDGKECASANKINFVYDCGRVHFNQSNVDDSLRKAIDEYICSLSSTESNIDLLVISHFDKDHYSGLKFLKQQADEKGITIDKVWVPAVDIGEVIRLIGSWYSDESGSDNPPDFWHKLEQFNDTIHGLFDESVIQEVNRSSGGEYDDDSRITGVSDGATYDRTIEYSEEHGARVTLRTHNKQKQVLWEVCPYFPAYVQDVVHDRQFINGIAKLFGPSYPNLPTEILITNLLAGDYKITDTESDEKIDILKRHFGELTKEARRKWGAQLKKDWESRKAKLGKEEKKNYTVHVSIGSGGGTITNITSLCLYSGPVGGSAEWEFDRAIFRRNVLSEYKYSKRDKHSWLGTGDAVFVDQPDINALIQTIAQQKMNRISVVSAPHHGSWNNSRDGFWDRKTFPNLEFATIEGEKHDTLTNHECMEQKVKEIGGSVFVASSDNHIEWIDILSNCPCNEPRALRRYLQQLFS